MVPVGPILPSLSPTLCFLIPWGCPAPCQSIVSWDLAPVLLCAAQRLLGTFSVPDVVLNVGVEWRQGSSSLAVATSSATSRPYLWLSHLSDDQQSRLCVCGRTGEQMGAAPSRPNKKNSFSVYCWKKVSCREGGGELTEDVAKLYRVGVARNPQLCSSISLFSWGIFGEGLEASEPKHDLISLKSLFLPL